ncbi:uncharacterized protein LOC135378160 [Ornithodoros turicata]|uniref:uncharacterized protein LOC135378160 n=1 Tax=Ornithodoros turicata TaxID=34597 RepID=UPI003139F15B
MKLLPSGSLVFSGILLCVLVINSTSARRRPARFDDEEEDGSSWLSDDKRHDDSPLSQDSGNYDDRDQMSSKADCDAQNFRRGHSECDRILRMNLPHHHGNHDFICYSLRKYKMCVANVMIQSSCYERGFVSQELHKIRGIIQGYSVDCFNITKETNQRIGRMRRVRYQLSRQKASPECNPARAWSLELVCTQEFEKDARVLTGPFTPAHLKETCSSVVDYYKCLSPMGTFSKCQKDQKKLIDDITYFPKALTTDYKSACKNELKKKVSHFFWSASETARQVGVTNCREPYASREFLACAIVYNEVKKTSVNDMSRICMAFKNFVICTENIADRLRCRGEAFQGAATNVVMTLLYEDSRSCSFTGRMKRGRSGGIAGEKEDIPPGPETKAEKTTEGTVEETERTRARRNFNDFIYKATTKKPRSNLPLDHNPVEDMSPGERDKKPDEDQVLPPSEIYRFPVGGEDRRRDNSARRGQAEQPSWNTVDPDHGDHAQSTNPPPFAEGNPNEVQGKLFVHNKAGREDEREPNEQPVKPPKNDIPSKRKASGKIHDDGYPPDPNDGFLEDMDDMDMEAVHRRRKKLHKRRLHRMW